MRVVVLIVAGFVITLAALWLYRGEHDGSRALSEDLAPSLGPQWNYFRGPSAGVSSWSNAPVSWDGPSGRGVIWKAPLKMVGVSSPVVWSNRVYITEGNDKERAVLAFDAADGRQLWRQIVPDGGAGAPLPSVTDAGLALPTPACDEHGVYALFGTGDLAAFSHNGKQLWRIFLGRPVIGYGFASSPCVTEGLLLVQFDTHTNGRVMAIETATGKIKWAHDRLRGAAWSSPILIPGAKGKPLFVLNASGSITAFDLAGEVVWDLDGVTGEVAPSPAYWNGHIYAVNAGSLLLCYRLAERQEKLWQDAENLSNTSSPVAVNGLLFMASGNGRLVCLDALTGKELWTHQSRGCYASLTAGGERVYVLSRNGTMQIVAAERAYRLIGMCDLGEGSDATPAFDEGRIYIRGQDHLWCLGGEGVVR